MHPSEPLLRNGRQLDRLPGPKPGQGPPRCPPMREGDGLGKGAGKLDFS